MVESAARRRAPKILGASAAAQGEDPALNLLLVTNGLTYGGAERIVETLALWFHRRVACVHVAAVTRDGPIGEVLRAHGVGVTVLKIRSPFDASAPIRLARLAREVEADLIHSHLEVSDIAVALASPAVRRAKTVTTVHNLGLGALAASRWKRVLWTRALPRFDRVLAVSRAVADRLPPGIEATVLHPSILSRDRPQPDRARARRSLRIADDVPVVLGIGRLSFEKGFDVLGRAAERLSTLGARVLVIGDGPEREPLLAHPHLELLGPRPDAGDLMAAADVIVCPSRTEGFPQVPLQAMFAGVPVVATRVGGTPEIVIDGETGALVPPEDPEALADAIVRVLSRGRSLGENGRRRIFEAGFTAEVMCERHEEVYRTLARGAFNAST